MGALDSRFRGNDGISKHLSLSKRHSSLNPLNFDAERIEGEPAGGGQKQHRSHFTTTHRPTADAVDGKKSLGDQSFTLRHNP